MKKIVILTIAEGHLSIAKAISQKLSANYECVVLPYRIAEFDLYLPMYQLFPSLFKVPYKLSEYQSAQNFARSMVAKKYEEKIIALLDEQSPDLIISTYFLYDEICARYANMHGIHCVNAVANPRTIHPLEGSDLSDANLVFDHQAIDTLVEFGVPKEKILETGWFVREQFVPVEEKEIVRKKLKLLTHPQTFLFTAGSDGSTTILKILPLFFQITTPLQVIFICGNNASLYKSLKLFLKTFHFAQRHSSVRFVILRFVSNIHEYMQASDLIIGKAGPNSLFEAVACHLPFFALTHISGQEDGNLELIEEYKLGFVEENPLKAIALLKTLTATPELIESYRESVIAMATHNAKSEKKLSELISTLLPS